MVLALHKDMNLHLQTAQYVLAAPGERVSWHRGCACHTLTAFSSRATVWASATWRAVCHVT